VAKGPQVGHLVGLVGIVFVTSISNESLVIVAQTTSLRGPIRKHKDLLILIVMSSHASSTSHLCKRCCKRVTDGDKSNMSSAYKIIWQPFTDDSNLLISSRYTANKKRGTTLILALHQN